MRLLLLVLVFVSSAQGFELSDGGDVVFCRGSFKPEEPPGGDYSLDYLVTLGLDFKKDVPVTNLQESFNRIENILISKVGNFVESFQTYRKYYRNWRTHLPHAWLQATATVRNLHNPDVVDLVPENCSQGEHISVLKVVNRQPQANGQVFYLYLPQILDQMERRNPLQASYLAVHEWLWSITDHPARIRRINRFLHSSSIDEMSREEVIAQLQGMGL